MSDPHADSTVETAGAPPQVAQAAVVMCPGRGDSARHFLRLADDFHRRGVRYVAPEPAGKAWYPGPINEPPGRKARYPGPINEPPGRKAPYLRSAFGLLESAFGVVESMKIPRERTVLVGFSQGATVAAEYVASCPTRYGGLAAFAGGLLGSSPADTDHEGDLDGTPALFGAGADDPRFDASRATGSAATYRRLGADARAETYPGLGHAINDEEVNTVGRFLDAL